MAIYKIVSEYTFSPKVELAKLESRLVDEGEGEMADEEKQVVPDIYFDAIRVTAGLFGVNFTLSLRPPHPGKTVEEDTAAIRDIVVARTSLQHAKSFAMLLTKQLKLFEKTNGEVTLPKDLYDALEIDPKNW